MTPSRHRAPAIDGDLDRSGWPARRGALVLAVALTITAILASLAAGIPSSASAATVANPPTVVSLTFDDGTANQLAAASTMNSAGVDGTFYVISGFVGAPNYFSRGDLDNLSAAGHEIGGHTVTHPDLATVPADEVARQICNDRSTLTGWGFNVRSFAYPYASSTPAIEAAASDCGYNSARMLGDIKSRFGCDECAYAEEVPPANPYYTKAVDMVQSDWTLQDLQDSVTNAETNGGGWVQLTFHNICESGCGDPTMTPALFASFIDWLAPRAAAQNTVVKTVGDVIGGAAKPIVAGPIDEPLAPGVNGVVNPSLETVTGTMPACYIQGGYGANTRTFQLVSPGRTGSVANKITMTGYTDGDAKLVPTLDSGACAPTVAPGRPYELGAWYTSTTVTQFAVFLRNSAGAWQYWTSSPWFAPSASFAQALYTTPPVPAGFTGISFGLNIFGNGEITTDDYSIYDRADAPPPPAVQGVVNASLETPGATGAPSCWAQAGFGDNTAVFSSVSPGRTGTVANKITMTGYASGDAKLIPAFDDPTCIPAVAPGRSYALSAWYTSTTVTQYAVYLRTTAGVWQYWTSSPWFAPSPAFAEAAWTTPAVPAGYNGISFGLNIFGNGEIVTDDYSVVAK